MTKEEFIERKKAFDARPDWPFRIFLSVYAVGVFSWDWITERVNEVNVSLLSWGVKNIVGLLVLFTIGFAFLRGWRNKRRAQQKGLLCVHCSELLTDNLGILAIATGNCGKCGQKAFCDKSA